MTADVKQFAIKYELRKLVNRDLLIDPSMDFRDPKMVASFLQHLQFLPHERQLILFLDHAGRCLGTLEYRGSETSVHVPIGEIAACAILSGAKRLVLAHNHPTHLIDGELEFSEADLSVIEEFTWMLGVLGIKLHDSIIISANRFTSYQMQLQEKKRKDELTAYQRGDLILVTEELPEIKPEAETQQNENLNL